ncbi:MAG: hypothetical protein ACKOVH_10275 [Actinomycetota bacterium]
MSRPTRIPGRAGCVVGLIVVAVVVTGCTLVPRSATDRTDEWDPEVLEVARQVERLRGLEFREPVRVRYLPQPRFERSQRTDPDDLTRGDRRRLEQQTQALRSLALIGPDVDLLAAYDDAREGIGYYDPATKVITMPGTGPTPADREVLAHELTHALQDQVFGLGRVTRRGAAPLVVNAVVEGDATRTGIRWYWSLPARERRAIDAADEASADKAAIESTTDPGTVDALELQAAAPYELGRLLVENAKWRRYGGVNSLYRRPPPTEAPLVSPWRLGDGDPPGPAPEPVIAADETRIGKPERIDAFGLYMLLASRIGADQALAAADRWDGDSWVVVRRGDTVCSRIAVRSRSRGGLPVVRRAIEAWVTSLPGGVASATTEGRIVTLTACDDGTSTIPMRDGVDATLGLIWDRNHLFSDLSGLPESVARCAADRSVRDPVFQPLSYAEPEAATDAEAEAFWARVDEIIDACGGDPR